MARFDVSSIGFYVLDILGRPVTRIPEGGRADYIEEIRMTVAGTAGATAVDCAILGLSTQAVTTVGDDEMGDFLHAKMVKFGVDCGLVKRSGATQTSATILPVRPNGERPALHVPGTAAIFTVADEDLDAALDARIVHVGGTGLLKAFDGEPTVRLLKKAKALGRITTFDLIQANPETFALVEPCLPYIDYFVPSIEEAGEMAGMHDPREVARFYKARGVKNAILTMGADGVHVSPEKGEDFVLPAFDIPVSDTTGCGDSFTAGIIVGIIKGWELREAARFASAVAAKVAMGLGSDGKLVSFEDTLEAMNSLPLRRKNAA
ncbi:sugar kinase [Rhizobium sp. TRM96647]|uniref:carbohydrate kinase family protein n=1 Tax=unclassified Rhizobium TaxID=2613769 RepID=UPI0021E7F4B8|nr:MULTISPECIES: sugar kinase [unclassified Rhizobium]MCV3739200.1 sugar kinase [Rhizobium sp. TRM96647]MCV3760922.1 sugar kinase [Rhizobium sp. TRM96650]